MKLTDASWDTCFLFGVLLLVLGCIEADHFSQWNTNTYKAAILSGRKCISPALEMEKDFVNTEHLLIMYGVTGSTSHEWQTVSFFGGRYTLTMVSEVVLSEDGTQVVSATPATFVLWVCESIAEDGGGASFDSSRERKFGLETWQEFRDSGFEIALLDPEYDGSILPRFEEYANGWQASRKVWR